MSKFDLNNKKIVVIGGTSGIGLAASQAFVEWGARVMAVGKDDQSVGEAREKLGRHAICFGADAADPETATRAIDQCTDQLGGFDGLYHVAGGSGRKMGDGPLHELSLEGWNKTLELNLTSTMLSNQAAVRKFLALKTGGTILNMGSVLGYSPSPAYFYTHAYAAAKSAIIGFSKSIASYYATKEIRVNVIAPALVETPMSLRASGNDEIRSFIMTKQPLCGGGIGNPHDLDGLAVYFMSDASKYTTGQVVAVDGGWSVSDGQKQTTRD